MKAHFRRAGLFVCIFSSLLLLGAAIARAQSAGTGAIAGTVTDSSGGTVANVTVTATSLGTNQTRTATTGADGVFKFPLLLPGNYSVKFTAQGFKTAEISRVTVTVTETATVNQTLQVGAVTQEVTVSTTAQVLQTESSTLGGTVSGSQIDALPMANRNYTEILSLSAGAGAGVENAASVGKGTQDMSVNGANPGQNNFMMDGIQVDNLANSGSANDGTIYTGIPIPNPDAIQEFKVQTSTYDASYGRNPGANVNMVTKSGTNNFHGTGFEFFRNSVLNADNFFYVKTPGQQHQVFNQNQFGGTLGGPIKKDKLFFFISYEGTRSKNGVAPQGETFGAILPPLPATRTAATLGAALCGFGNTPALACNGSNISTPGLNLMNLKNPNGSYFFPSPNTLPQFCGSGPLASGPNAGFYQCNFSVPAIYNENQMVANGDYIINSKNTLSTRYFYQHAPQEDFLGQAGGNIPGTPEDILYANHNAVVKLTSLVSNNFVNEASVSMQRNVNISNVQMPPGGSPAQLGITPVNPGFFEPPTMIFINNNFTAFGGLLPDNSTTTQFQFDEQISWQHGKHAIRAGYEYEYAYWPISDQGLQQGLLLTGNVFDPRASFGDMLVGTNVGNGAEFGGFNVGCLFCSKGIASENAIIHFYQIHDQDAFIADDWKVNTRLTLNIGLRWEYEGLLSDKYGRLTQVWLDRMAPNSVIPTSFSATNPLGVLQYVVPSNFAAHFGPPPIGVGTAPNQNTIEGHAPYSNFAPRFGFAWQPLSNDKLVVRGGAGLFYDRVGLDSIVHAFEQGYPYAATYDYGFFSPRWFQSTLAAPYPPISLVCMPSDPNCNTDFGLGFAPRFSNYATGASSGLSTPFDPTTVHTPLIRQYNLGIQYEFEPGWVLNVGYVGSSGINLLDYNHNVNQSLLATPTNSLSYLCSGGTPNICNTSNNASFRVPYLGYEAAGLQASDFNGYSNYNSLQVTVQHQFSNGLSLQAAYTWDRNLSDVFFGNTANINNALCMMCQYGPVSFDRPQRLVVNYSYDLPFGKHATGLEKTLINGWTVSGVTIAQSGDFLTFIAPGITGTAYGTSNTSYLSGLTTAQFCPGFGNGSVKAPGGVGANLNHYWNTAAFFQGGAPCQAGPVPYGDATAQGYGNSGVGVASGPGQFNWDISLLKNNQITERVNLQFRADFYNAFNHPQFADPGGAQFGTVGFENVTSPQFGQIFNTDVNPRLIQFGVHLFF